MLEHRLTTVEVQVAALKEMAVENKQEHSEIKGQLNRLDEKIDKIDLHLARQNGAIPHLQTDVDRLIRHLDKVEKQQSSSRVKVKALWAIFVAGATALVGLAVKFLVFV